MPLPDITNNEQMAHEGRVSFIRRSMRRLLSRLRDETTHYLNDPNARRSQNIRALWDDIDQHRDALDQLGASYQPTHFD